MVRSWSRCFRASLVAGLVFVVGACGSDDCPDGNVLREGRCVPIVDVCDERRFYVDEDGDGFGVGEVQLACEVPDGFAVQPGDCDDGDESRAPMETELCNGIDEDCDGVLDEGAGELVSFFEDTDDDGFGAGEALIACAGPMGYVDRDGDCEPSEMGVSPDALEVCDGRDNNCDGTFDPSGVWLVGSGQSAQTQAIAMDVAGTDRFFALAYITSDGSASVARIDQDGRVDGVAPLRDDATSVVTVAQGASVIALVTGDDETTCFVVSAGSVSGGTPLGPQRPLGHVALVGESSTAGLSVRTLDGCLPSEPRTIAWSGTEPDVVVAAEPGDGSLLIAQEGNALSMARLGDVSFTQLDERVDARLSLAEGDRSLDKVYLGFGGSELRTLEGETLSSATSVAGLERVVPRWGHLWTLARTGDQVVRAVIEPNGEADPRTLPGLAATPVIAFGTPDTGLIVLPQPDGLFLRPLGCAS